MMSISTLMIQLSHAGNSHQSQLLSSLLLRSLLGFLARKLCRIRSGFSSECYLIFSHVRRVLLLPKPPRLIERRQGANQAQESGLTNADISLAQRKVQMTAAHLVLDEFLSLLPWTTSMSLPALDGACHGGLVAGRHDVSELAMKRSRAAQRRSMEISCHVFYMISIRYYYNLRGKNIWFACVYKDGIAA